MWTSEKGSVIHICIVLISLAPKLRFFVDAHITIISPLKYLVALHSIDSDGMSHFQMSTKTHTLGISEWHGFVGGREMGEVVDEIEIRCDYNHIVQDFNSY